MDLWRREARPVLDAAMTWKRYDDYMARSIGQLARYAMEDVRECAEREKESMQWDWYVEDTMGGLIEPAAHILRGKHEAT